MSLIRGLFWLVLFIFFTFSFVVLFEYCVEMVSKPKASPSPGAKKK